MAVITKQKLKELVVKGDCSFTPNLDQFQVQEHAVDLRLGFTFMIPKSWRMTSKGRESIATVNFDVQNQDLFEIVELEEGQYFDLLPGEHILVSTLESLKLPTTIMGVVYPRSSVNRRGISLDLTGIVDAGYEGKLILPLRNNTSGHIIRLYPGERICQIVLEELTDAVNPYRSKYYKRDAAEGVGKEKRNETGLVLKGGIQSLKAKYPFIKAKPDAKN